jgi:hypothetical protein
VLAMLRGFVPRVFMRAMTLSFLGVLGKSGGRERKG